MKTVKKPILSVIMLFFAVFLIDFSLLPNLLSTSVYAEGEISTDEPTSQDTPNTPETPENPNTPDTPDTPNTPETPPIDEPTTDDSGSQWSGEITDPANQNQSSKELVVTEITTTVTPPAGADSAYVEIRTSSGGSSQYYNQSNNYSQPGNQPDSQSETATTTEESADNNIITTIEKNPETSTVVKYIIDLSDILASYENDSAKAVSKANIEVPKTQSATNNHLNDVLKTCLIILTSIGIITAINTIIWASDNLSKLNQAEKLYQAAKTKESQQKRAKITRRAY